jgi:23S rRNA (pseudouridine1915-N3)-methyltransferase
LHLRVVALGHRMPAWIDAGWAEYASRLPRDYALQLVEVKPEPRDRGRTIAQLLAAEAARIGREWDPRRVRIALDERGQAWTTRELARRIGEWRDGGRDLVFAIGSADGLDPSIRGQADVLLSLSALTLPHGLVRVILAEQIFRAVSLLAGHPYHRD